METETVTKNRRSKLTTLATVLTVATAGAFAYGKFLEHKEAKSTTEK